MTSTEPLPGASNGVGFGPLPTDPRENSVATDEMTFLDDLDREITLRLDRTSRTLYMQVDGSGEQVLLEGVSGPRDDDGTELGAFQLEYVNGSKLVRASFDLTVAADDTAQLAIEGNDVVPIRLVGSTAPRRRRHRSRTRRARCGRCSTRRRSGRCTAPCAVSASTGARSTSSTPAARRRA